MLMGSARRRVRRSAQPVHVSERSHPDAARARVQQHALPRAQRASRERNVRRAPHRGKRARLLERERGRLRREQPAVAASDRRERRNEHAEHRATRARVLRAERAAAIGHHASAVGAGHAGVARVRTEHVEHVAEVEAHRAHTNLRLERREARGERCLRPDGQVAQRAARVHVQLGKAGHRRRRRTQPRHEHVATVLSNLRLGRSQAHRAHATAAPNVDARHAEQRRLQTDGTRDAPQARVHRAHERRRACGLRAARHQQRTSRRHVGRDAHERLSRRKRRRRLRAADRDPRRAHRRSVGRLRGPPLRHVQVARRRCRRARLEPTQPRHAHAVDLAVEPHARRRGVNGRHRRPKHAHAAAEHSLLDRRR